MAALLLCCSATAQTVDEAWAATPAAQDTPWAQVNMPPVRPSNSGGGNSVKFYTATGRNGPTTSNDGLATAYAECPVGRNVVSGGGDNGGVTAPDNHPVSNNPVGNGWKYSVQFPRNTGNTGMIFTVTAWVGCQ